MANQPLPTKEERICVALNMLRGLSESDAAVLELMALGQASVEPLRQFVARRDPTGLFQPRCQAVAILAALGARDVLLDLLAHPRAAIDPVEQTGEEAVTSAIARSLSKWPDEEVFSALLDTGRRKPLAGVVEALGNFRCHEAIPIYDAALAEDFSRPAAEDAFRKLGASVAVHLLWLAGVRLPSVDSESESSKRRRRSALKLLAELPEAGELAEELQMLVEDPDPRVAILASSLCLPRARPEEKARIVTRLVGFLGIDDWMLAADVKELLNHQSRP